MAQTVQTKITPVVTTEIVESLTDAELADLCDITETTVQSGSGFDWLSLPGREVMERYWRGVLTVPQRHLIIARLDGVICGAIQLIEPARHSEAHHFAANLATNFVAPWARGQRIGAELVNTAENLAVEKGYHMLNLDVRATQKSAITLYKNAGFEQWGTNPRYAFIDENFIAGLYFSKSLDGAPPRIAAAT